MFVNKRKSVPLASHKVLNIESIQHRTGKLIMGTARKAGSTELTYDNKIELKQLVDAEVQRFLSIISSSSEFQTTSVMMSQMLIELKNIIMRKVRIYKMKK